MDAAARFDPLLRDEQTPGNGQPSYNGLRFATIDVGERRLAPAVTGVQVIETMLRVPKPSEEEGTLANWVSYASQFVDVLEKLHQHFKNAEVCWNDLRVEHATALATLQGTVRDEVEKCHAHTAQIIERAHTLCDTRLGTLQHQPTNGGAVLMKSAEAVRVIDQEMLALHVHAVDREVRGGFQDTPFVRWAMNGSGRIQF
jgi:hypothetical protein